MTCSKFDYSRQVSCCSIICIEQYKKSIWLGQYLTHSFDISKNNQVLIKNIIANSQTRDKIKFN